MTYLLILSTACAVYHAFAAFATGWHLFVTARSNKRQERFLAFCVSVSTSFALAALMTLLWARV